MYEALGSVPVLYKPSMLAHTKSSQNLRGGGRDQKFKDISPQLQGLVED